MSARLYKNKKFENMLTQRPLHIAKPREADQFSKRAMLKIPSKVVMPPMIIRVMPRPLVDSTATDNVGPAFTITLGCVVTLKLLDVAASVIAICFLDIRYQFTSYCRFSVTSI